MSKSTQSNTMASSQKAKPLSILKIQLEAIKLLAKSSPLILPILLLSFVSYSLLSVFSNSSLNPITADLISESMSLSTLDPKSPEYASAQAALMKTLGEFFGMEGIIMTVTFILSSLITIATLRAFSLTRDSSEKLPAGNMSALFRLVRGLKGPMITTLYVRLFSLGYLFLLVAMFGISLLVANGSMILIASGGILLLLGLAGYVYLVMVWSVSVVISVADEDGCYGLDAVSRAVTVIRGRRMQAAALALIEIMGSLSLAYAVYYIAKGYVLPSAMQPIGALVVYEAVSLLAGMFNWAMIMVFYCDCRRTSGGDDIMGFIYGSLPTTADKDDHEGAVP